MPKKEPPYKDPSEAINYIRDNYTVGKWTDAHAPSWREVAEIISKWTEKPTNKGTVWNVAHGKYKCPKEIADALVKMKLLKRKKRWRFFFELPNEAEYKAFKKHVLAGSEFSEWIWEMVRQSNAV